MPPPPPAATTPPAPDATAAAAAATTDPTTKPQWKPLQGRRKDNPDHPRRGGAKNRNRPRAVALAPAALQDAGRLALSGFPNDPEGYDAVLKRVHEASERFIREFGDLADEEQQGKNDDATTAHRHEAARAARCAFHHAYAHNPFACSGCWLLPGRCICDLVRTQRILLPRAVARVVVHAHHSEWRRASSTGVLAPLVLQGAGGESSVLSLMAGHTPHDDLMASMVADPRWLPVLLFPRRPPTGSGNGDDDGDATATTTASAPSASLDEVVALALELKQKQQQQQQQQEHQTTTLPLLLIVPDGTWQQARRLSLGYAAPGGKYYDPRLQFLELPSEAVAAVAARGKEEDDSEGREEEEEQAPAATTPPPPPSSQQPQQNQRTVSLLAPARLYRGAAKCPQRVSTAEALAAALEGLERARVRAVGAGEKEDGANNADAAVRAIVRAVQLKVAAVRRQSGKEKLPVP